MSQGLVFISHVSEDRRRALSIVEALEANGIACWIAPRNVQPGRPFDDEIAAAIENSAAMVLVFSERCNDNDYIRREVTFAGEAGKRVIPVRIENAQPKKGLRMRLADLHWVDAFASSSAAIEEIVRTLAPTSPRPETVQPAALIKTEPAGNDPYRPQRGAEVPLVDRARPGPARVEIRETTNFSPPKAIPASAHATGPTEVEKRLEVFLREARARRSLALAVSFVLALIFYFVIFLPLALGTLQTASDRSVIVTWLIVLVISSVLSALIASAIVGRRLVKGTTSDVPPHLDKESLERGIAAINQQGSLGSIVKIRLDDRNTTGKKELSFRVNPFAPFLFVALAMFLIGWLTGWIGSPRGWPGSVPSTISDLPSWERSVLLRPTGPDTAT